jgi:hypothetical protein
MALTHAELYDQFFKIVERGDQATARKFLIENLKQFPRETQDAIITAFLEDALVKKQADDAAVVDFRKEGLKMMDALQKGKKILEKQAKLTEIKENL